MLRWALAFLIVALVAALLGFGDIAAARISPKMGAGAGLLHSNHHHR
jgi:Protein of unknown function (DUF1328)